MHKTGLNVCSQLNMNSLLQAEFLIFFSFSVLFDLMISAFLPLKQHVSSQPTEYATLHYQTSTVNKDLASDFQIQQGLKLENFKSFKNGNKKKLLHRFTFQVSRSPKTLLSNWNSLNTKDYLPFLGAMEMLPTVDDQIKDGNSLSTSVTHQEKSIQTLQVHTATVNTTNSVLKVSHLNSRRVQYNLDRRSLTSQWCKSKALPGQQRRRSGGTAPLHRRYGAPKGFPLS